MTLTLAKNASADIICYTQQQVGQVIKILERNGLKYSDASDVGGMVVALYRMNNVYTLHHKPMPNCTHIQAADFITAIS